MADNFNFTKFLKDNPLLKESIGGYKDIEPLKEESVEEGADFTRFYKVGAKYDNSDNPIGGFKEYTIVSVDPENQTVTVKGANGVKTFDAWEFGNDFMPARSKEDQWQDKYGPGADRFN